VLILGWHGGIKPECQDLPPGWSTHDGAAVLLRDGEILAAVEEERLNRVKHSNFLPANAITRCLEQAAVRLSEVDVVAMNFLERTREIFPVDAGLPSVDAFLEDPTAASPTVRGALAELFERHFATDVSDRFHFCNHHVAHLWSAWGPSGFHEALAISIDGSGDALSGMIATAGPAGLDPIRELPVALSLGNLYSDSVRFLGYKRFDEYKVMGLAPYGDPRRFAKLFEQFYELLPEGAFRLTAREERWGLIDDARLVTEARRSGRPFTQVHCDFAAALQTTLETIVMHVVRHFAAETGQRHLCYAGGVAHNCTLNGRLLREDLFDEIFVQPAAHDAGGALGAALHAERTVGGGAARPAMPHLFLGSDLPGTTEISERLAAWDAFIECDRPRDPVPETARLLADGAVVGWVQGRSEFGPRALGHRSILADPRPAANKARINEMVKKRESYRPFAPSILEEYLDELAVVPRTKADMSFMTYTLVIREHYRPVLGAITHVDGSARIQSVSRSRDEQYWRLIETFRSLTGIPAILNTSFNNNAEPIVDSVDDAVTCFLTTGIDVMVVGDVLVRRRDDLDLATAVGRLRPRLPRSRKLVARVPDDDCEPYVFSVESTASQHFVQPRQAISADAYGLLVRADGRCRADELLTLDSMEDEKRHRRVLQELLALWERRAVVLKP